MFQFSVTEYRKSPSTSVIKVEILAPTCVSEPKQPQSATNIHLQIHKPSTQCHQGLHAQCFSPMVRTSQIRIFGPDILSTALAQNEELQNVFWWMVRILWNFWALALWGQVWSSQIRSFYMRSDAEIHKREQINAAKERKRKPAKEPGLKSSQGKKQGIKKNKERKDRVHFRGDPLETLGKGALAPGRKPL